MLVRATGASKALKVNIKELGRIANDGEYFEVTESRFKVLNGANRFRAKFVVPAEPITTKSSNTKQVVVVNPKQEHADAEVVTKARGNSQPPSTPQKFNSKAFKESLKKLPDEKPIIKLILPGQDPVVVDENLNPIPVEEPPKVEEEPKPKEPILIQEDTKVEEQVTEGLPEIEKPKKGSGKKSSSIKSLKVEQLPEKPKAEKISEVDAKLDTTEENAIG